jgi:hypothetical protein
MQLHKKACPPLLFWFPFLLQSKLVVRKQGRCALKASAGKEFRREILPCFRKMRRVHRAPGRAPLLRNTPVFRGRSVCPPWPRREACLMVFARDALASGPGKAWNVIAFTPTWRKVKVGKHKKIDKKQGVSFPGKPGGWSRWKAAQKQSRAV